MQNFMLKGDFLIAVMVGLDTRATMDMDVTIKGWPVNADSIRKMFLVKIGFAAGCKVNNFRFTSQKLYKLS